MPQFERGFTLVEIVTTIALIGILSAILVPNISDWSKKRGVSAETNEARSLLNYAKGYSLNNRATTRVAFDEEASRLVVFSGVDVQSCSDEAICFYKDGSSSGGEIQLSNDYAKYVLSVFSATGFIELSKEI
jgi:prepilin-type N-terminal cleavage/methylation domain-containing protein